MSLVAWFPLRDNYENKGFDEDVRITNIGTELTTVRGNLNKCVYFNQPNHNNIQISDAGFMDKYINNNSFTIMVWIRPEVKPSTLFGFTYGLWSSISADGEVSFQLYDANGKLNKAISSKTRVFNRATPDITEWHHVALAFNKNNFKMSLYIDGVLEASDIYQKRAPYNSVWTNTAYIGRNPNSAPDNFYYAGHMCDVRIYNEEVSAYEISEIAKGCFLSYSFNDPCLANSENLVSGLVKGGQTTIVNGNTVQTTGVNKDTYFFLNVSEDLIENKYYTISCYATIDDPGYFNFGICGQTAADPNFIIKNGYNEFSFICNAKIAERSRTEKNLLFDDRQRIFKPSSFYDFKIVKGEAANPYNDIQVTTISDNSENAFDATFQNGYLTRDTNRGDYALRLTGRTDTYKVPDAEIATVRTDFGYSILLDEFTICWTEKINKLGYASGSSFCLSNNSSLPGDYTTVTLCDYDGSFKILSEGGNKIILYKSNILNEWHSYSLVYKNKTGVLYRDGKVLKTATNANMTELFPFRYLYLDVSAAGGARRNNDSYYSEFKFYYKALTESDIVDLYETAVAVDNLGGLTAYQIAEESISPEPANENKQSKAQSFEEEKYMIPSEYTALEYIKSSGSQFINTGINPSSKTKVWMDFKNTTHNFHALFGARSSMTVDVYGLWNNYTDKQINYHFKDGEFNRDTITLSYSTYNKRRLYITDKTKLIVESRYLDLQTKYPSKDFNFKCNYPLAILAMNSGNSFDTRRAIGELYGVKIFEDDVLVSDLIPARRNSDGVLGVYDRIRNIFLTNSGSGTFTAGPEMRLDFEIVNETIFEVYENKINTNKIIEL